MGGSRTTVLGAPVRFSHPAHTDGFSQVNVTGHGCGASVEPIRQVSGEVERILWEESGEQGAEERGNYQSMDCGGSSFEGEVLTVSTQPNCRDLVRFLAYFYVVL